MKSSSFIKHSLFLLVLASCGTGASSTSGSSIISSTTSGSSIISSTTPTSSVPSITGVPNEAFEFALSTNRLQAVDFNISLDELIGSTQPLSRRKVDNTPRYTQTQSPGTTVIDTVNDTISYSNLPDSSNVGLEFRNLNAGITSTAESAKNQVDWAIGQLSVVNTWVDLGQEQYLLQYDQATDIVSLFIANSDFISEEDDTYMLKRITVQYTEQGELLVEVYDAQKTSGFAYFSHLSFIKGSLYEWSSDIWANGVREEVPMAGGPGWFKAIKNPETNLWMYWRSSYFNAGFNVQIPSGWIQTYVRIAPEDDNPSDDIARFNQIKVASGGLENDVLSFELYDSSDTNLTFYPSAFTGWSTIQAPFSSVDVKNLQDWTPINPDVAVYETTEAELVVDAMHDLDAIATTVRPSNIDDLEGEGYVGYVAESRVTLFSNYRTMLPTLLETFNTYGLGYKHGNLTDLFTDVIAVTNNLDRLFNQFELNGVSGFSTLETLRAVVDDEMDVITSLASTFTPLINLYPTLAFADLPPVVLNANELLNISDALTGTVSFNEETKVITTDNLSISLEPSVFLTPDSDYTLAYGWFVDGYVMTIGGETPVTYDGTTWSLTGGTMSLYDIPSQARTYQLVAYLVKVVGETSLRISAYTPVSVATFTETVITSEPMNGFESTAIYSENDGLFLTISYTDIQGPTVSYNPFDLTFTGTSETNVLSLTLPDNQTILDFAEAFTLTDNLDSSLLFDLSQLTWSEGIIESVLDLVQLGTYTYTIADSAGNETVLTIIITETVSE